MSEEPKYNNWGFTMLPNFSQKDLPPSGKNKKRNRAPKDPDENKIDLTPELKALKEPETMIDEKNLILEENASPINDFDHKTLFPLKSSFWEFKEKNPPKDLLKEDFLKKEEDNLEKTENICKEIALLAKDILRKMNENIIAYNLKSEVQNFNNKFEFISLSLLKKNQTSEDNIRVFKMIEEFYNENQKITGYEAQNYHFCENFLKFLFENTLPTLKPIHISPSKGKERKENELIKYQDRNEEHNQLINLTENISPSIQMSIIKRIIAFYLYFSRHSLNDNKGIFSLKKKYNKNNIDTYMQIMIHNLIEILSNLECSSFNIAQNENELTLEQDFYILSNKERVKVKYRDYQESSLKKLRTFNSSKKDQKELYEKFEYLNARFKEIPLLLLTAEAHHTLEVFEDYLLNNINERDSLSLSSLGHPKNSLFQDYKLGALKKVEESEDDMEEELEIHEEEDDDEDVDEEEYDLNSDELHLKNNNVFPPKTQKENSLKSGFICFFIF